jgi:hypothetical protein
MKLDVMGRSLLVDMLGLDFDYFDLPDIGTCGGHFGRVGQKCLECVLPPFQGALALGYGRFSWFSAFHLVAYNGLWFAR